LASVGPLRYRTTRLHDLSASELQRRGAFRRPRQLRLLCLAATVLSANNSATESRGATPHAEELRTIHLRSADVPRDGLIRVQFDPIYRSPKRYRGVPLARYLRTHGIAIGDETTNAAIQFKCDDGYSPLASLFVLVRDHAFIAASDVDVPPGNLWTPFNKANREHTPGPFYLVWPDVTATDPEHPWPYGIVELSVGAPKALLAAALPRSAAMEAGFALFRTHCIKCHAINGSGGSLGIDLNSPMNIFEYWQPDKIASFVAHPERFRTDSRMPSFFELGDATIGEILRYVEQMRDYKVVGTPPPSR
jgi:mono/diheme cytochrome c family protein